MLEVSRSGYYAWKNRDISTKKIVGYAFSNRIDTSLVKAALDMAVRREKPDKELIFHSDRGVQYASKEYRKALKHYGIRQSISPQRRPI